ncbi:MAG: glycosyltransferase family 2 protein [Geminicoccaceae bacterium]|nr:glycosyltransferase family 2 protein [Geminicoccaceae bacterium]
MSTPLVSVLVPAWNVAPWLAEGLGSVLAQSLAELEVVLVDDASTDSTLEIARGLAARDPRLVVVARPTNGGSARARNDALAVARAPWIAVFDADDRMAPDRLARLLAVAESRGAVWVADDQWVEFAGDGALRGRLLTDEPEGAVGLDLVRFLDRDPPEAIGYGTLKPLVRRDFLERHGIRWRPEAGRSDDFLFTLECLARGASAWLWNEPLYGYRLRPGSQVTRLDARATLRHLAAVQELAERLLADHPDPAVHAALARRRRRIAAASVYRELLAALRAGRLFAAAALLARTPGSSALLAAGALEALRRRLGPRRPPILAERRLFSSRLDRVADALGTPVRDPSARP